MRRDLARADFGTSLHNGILLRAYSNPMLLQGKVAVVTGGGRGIGRAIARRFAAEGAAVLIASRTEAELRSVANEIEQAGGKLPGCGAMFQAKPIARASSRPRRIVSGAVDILVNNAGDYGPVKPVEEISPEEWDRVIAVHLRGAFLLTRLVLPGMYQRKSGAIMNISSLSAKSAFSWGSPYAAAKAGMLGLTRVTAAEAARQGVRVNAICPGPVTETKMSKDLGNVLAARLNMIRIFNCGNFWREFCRAGDKRPTKSPPRLHSWPRIKPVRLPGSP